MSEWRGLHNPERHRPSWNHVTAWCDCGRFGVQCTTGYPCRCCLDAEVDRLTAELNLAASTVTELQGLLDRIVCQLEERDERISALESPLSTRLHNVPNGTPYEEDPGDWLCSCGQERVNASYTVERAGAKHSLGHCGPCCTHGRFISEVCKACRADSEETSPQASTGDCVGSKVCRPPEWRVSVDSWAESGVMGEAEDPLAAVLWLLHRVSLLQGVDKREVADALARIVAVCEGQVGDGWQADPDRGGDEDTRGTWMGSVLYMLADIGGDVMWREVADICAAWLRDLTLTLLMHRAGTDGAS